MQAQRKLSGRPTCPFCQFPIKPGAQWVTCPICRTPYHRDCWNLNGGCAVYGCPARAKEPYHVTAAKSEFMHGLVALQRRHILVSWLTYPALFFLSFFTLPYVLRPILDFFGRQLLGVISSQPVFMVADVLAIGLVFLLAYLLTRRLWAPWAEQVALEAAKKGAPLAELWFRTQNMRWEDGFVKKAVLAAFERLLNKRYFDQQAKPVDSVDVRLY